MSKVKQERRGQSDVDFLLTKTAEIVFEEEELLTCYLFCSRE